MLTTWVIAPLALWSTWLVWVGVLTGIGLLVRSAFVRTPEVSGESLFSAFWLGVGATTLFLLALNFVLPIGPGATLAVFVAGASGLVASGRPLLRGLQRAGRMRIYATFLALVVIGIWSGLHGLQEVAGFDTFMYLVPMVRWIQAMPVPPGLANLHERFGFNQGTLPLAALIESGPWVAGASHIVNGVFVTAMVLRIGGSLSSWPGTTPGDRARRFYDLIVLTPTLALIATPVQFRALDADIPATIAILSGLSLLVGPIFDASDRRRDALLAAGVAFTLGAVFKLSTASVAVPLWLVLFLICARSPSPRRLLLPLTAASAILAITWMARGVVLSGYPLYPNHVLSMPVDWRVPREQADASAAWVLYFAKVYYAPSQYNNTTTELVCGSVAWVGPWFRVLLTSSYWWRIPLPIVIAAGLWAILYLAPATRVVLRSVAPVATAIGVSGTIWYAISPRPDMGVPIAWGLAGVLAASAGAATIIPGRRWFARLPTMAFLAGGLALIALPLAGNVVHDFRSEPDRGLRAAFGLLTPPALPDSWLGVTRWEYPILHYRTASGLDLLRPDFHRCSRAPIPCTSHPAQNLRLRDASDLRSGFAVDGEWKAERYPNPNSDFLEVWRAARENGLCAPGLRTTGHAPNFQFERYSRET